MNHTFQGLKDDGSHAPHTDCCSICGYAKRAPIHEVEPPASWVIRERSTKLVICETSNPKIVAAITERYEAIPTLDYLGALNTSIRARDRHE
jgi:hypothetical protein